MIFCRTYLREQRFFVVFTAGNTKLRFTAAVHWQLFTDTHKVFAIIAPHRKREIGQIQFLHMLFFDKKKRIISWNVYDLQIYQSKNLDMLRSHFFNERTYGKTKRQNVYIYTLWGCFIWTKKSYGQRRVREKNNEMIFNGQT